MTIIDRCVQCEFIRMRDAKTSGVLWTKIDVAFHKSVFIQLHFERIQVLVNRTIDPAAISNTELALWILVESDGSTWKYICIMTLKTGIIRLIFASVLFLPR